MMTENTRRPPNTPAIETNAFRAVGAARKPDPELQLGSTTQPSAVADALLDHYGRDDAGVRAAFVFMHRNFEKYAGGRPFDRPKEGEPGAQLCILILRELDARRPNGLNEKPSSRRIVRAGATA